MCVNTIISSITFILILWGELKQGCSRLMRLLSACDEPDSELREVPITMMEMVVRLITFICPFFAHELV